MHKNKKGFSLVELSIVLIVVGLIIGGILVAQSMIEASRNSTTVAQIQQFDSAVANFRSEYKALPGDYKGFGVLTGDGDGIIDMPDITGYHDDVSDFNCEIANFWNHLNPA